MRVLPPVDPRGPELSRAETSLIGNAITCPGLPVSSAPVSPSSWHFSSAPHDSCIGKRVSQVCKKHWNLCAPLCAPCSSPSSRCTILDPHRSPLFVSALSLTLSPAPPLFTQLQNEGASASPPPKPKVKYTCISGSPQLRLWECYPGTQPPVNRPCAANGTFWGWKSILNHLLCMVLWKRLIQAFLTPEEGAASPHI